MRKIAIIGASGMAGSEIYKLASQNEDLAVTGIVRNEAKAKKILGDDAQLLIGDVLTMNDSLLEKFDIIVDAFGTSPENAAFQIDLAKKLVEVARKSKAKLIFILGAGSLLTGSDHHYFVEEIAKMPGAETWINTPKQQLKELQFLKGIKGVNWMGISPAAEFEPGPAGKYVIGGNDLLFNENGESKVTAGTMAKLVVKEAIEDKHHEERITIVNA
ncbi:MULTISPECIES: NAD(P)H-binding protein [Lactobacillus]|uniref:NADH-flavin reductase n=1 Tax=Lactobacillus xujianguonis TaxID=2495899 RepID=A0A437SVE8_9LACO|nr:MULTISPECIES: NAD(P)H-binding protein [Lactobacillus]RVU70830.1 NADH-flavin reductase [Lactobacillus xujianguonis]